MTRYDSYQIDNDMWYKKREHIYNLLGFYNEGPAACIIATYSLKTKRLLIKGANKHIPESSILKQFIEYAESKELQEKIMANRNTLAVSKLEDFKQWIIKYGWEIQETKGCWEVLRATKQGKKYPLIIYRKDKTIGGSENIVHLSVLDRDMGVIRAFLKELKEKQK